MTENGPVLAFTAEEKDGKLRGLVQAGGFMAYADLALGTLVPGDG